MTMNSGDLIACGTNHEGLGALQDGETVEIEIQNIGKMTLKVSDPLKRTWERGVYMGVDSTNPEAVKRHRPANRLKEKRDRNAYGSKKRDPGRNAHRLGCADPDGRRHRSSRRYFPADRRKAAIR